MKKLILLLAVAAQSFTAMAEGYQVNNLSSRQNGMGHVGTAMKLGSESLWFNPGAAAFQTGKFDISLGMTGIVSKATYTALPDYSTENAPARLDSDNKISTPLYIYANYKPLDWMSVGVAFNTPFGSAVKWNDDWAGAHLIQSIGLKAYNLQPTVSFRIGRHLSIGGGLMVTWGDFDISRSLLPVGSATNAMLDMLVKKFNPQAPDIFAAAGDRSIVSLGLSGSAKTALGVNLGVMWDINDAWSLGFSYRSKVKMKTDSGTVALDVIDDPAIAATVAQLLPALGLDQSAVSAARLTTELPLPATLTWGVSFRPVRKWEFAVDLQYVLWSAYDKLDIDLSIPGQGSIMQVPSQKNYSNTLAFRFGGQYHALDWLTARMGMYVDESPVSSDYLNPETPSMTKLAYTAGLSLRPAKFCAVDLGYSYVNSADPERTGSTPYTNILTGATSVFAGNYKARAHTFSLGLRFSF